VVNANSERDSKDKDPPIIQLACGLPPCSMDLFSTLWAAVLTFYDFLRSVPTFTATLSGVLAAFGLNALARGFWNHNTRQRLRRDLRNELRGSVTRLRERGIKRIETETLYVWQLAVHSGDARFLKADERKQIAEKYFLLDNYNYEAKITRALGDDYYQAIGMPDEESRRKWWTECCERMHKMEASLADDIERLVNTDNFWPKRS